MLFINAEGPVSRRRPGYLGAWLGFGRVFHTGSNPLGGFFVTPKVTIGAFRVTDGDPPMLDLLLGADVGYQLTKGPLFVAFVLGASVGAGLGENDAAAGPWIEFLGGARNKQGSARTWRRVGSIARDASTSPRCASGSSGLRAVRQAFVDGPPSVLTCRVARCGAGPHRRRGLAKACCAVRGGGRGWTMFA